MEYFLKQMAINGLRIMYVAFTLIIIEISIIIYYDIDLNNKIIIITTILMTLLGFGNGILMYAVYNKLKMENKVEINSLNNNNV
jgi:predicted ferric reductase